MAPLRPLKGREIWAARTQAPCFSVAQRVPRSKPGQQRFPLHSSRSRQACSAPASVPPAGGKWAWGWGAGDAGWCGAQGKCPVELADSKGTGAKRWSRERILRRFSTGKRKMEAPSYEPQPTQPPGSARYPRAVSETAWCARHADLPGAKTRPGKVPG